MCSACGAERFCGKLIVTSSLMRKPFILQNYDPTSLAWLPVKRFANWKEAVGALAEIAGKKRGKFRLFSLATMSVVAHLENNKK